MKKDPFTTTVPQMDQMTQQNAAMVEQTTAASHALAQEARELGRLVGRFQIDDRSVGSPLATSRPVVHQVQDRARTFAAASAGPQ